MLHRLIPALCWAAAMILLAVLTRLGVVDRAAATSLLLVMPILAFVSMRRRPCAVTKAA